ncbi:MAG: CHAT domain-containing protein, partial [Rhodospirillales bacterium]
NWPVHSAATTELTTDLFRRQAADANLSRAEALRQTRIHLIDEAGFKDADGNTAFSYAHPIFWAPFTVVGDGGGARAAGS